MKRLFATRPYDAPSAAGTGRVYQGWFPRAGYGLEPCEDAIADRKPGYLGFVFVSVVVVLPPSRSVSVFVWVSVLPAIPSRWTSFSITVLPFLSTSLWIVGSPTRCLALWRTSKVCAGLHARKTR